MENETQIVNISSKLFDLISNRISNSEKQFSNVDEYVEYVLYEILQPDDSDVYSKEDEDEIKKALDEMGYT